MKKLLLFAVIAFAMVGCRNESLDQTIGEGTIAIAAVADGQVATKSGEGGVTIETPALSDFSLTITGTDFEKSWASLSDYNTDDERYTAGWYTVAIECGDISEEGFDKPYFATSKKIQVLDRNRTTNVELTATVGNAIVAIKTTENFRNYFPEYKFKLTTATNEFELVEDATEHLFIAPQKKVAIDCTCIRQANMATQTEEALATQYIQTVNPQTRYVITYDLQSAGSVEVTVSLDNTVIGTIDVSVELNPNA